MTGVRDAVRNGIWLAVSKNMVRDVSCPVSKLNCPGCTSSCDGLHFEHGGSVTWPMHVK